MQSASTIIKGPPAKAGEIVDPITAPVPERHKTKPFNILAPVDYGLGHILICISILFKDAEKNSFIRSYAIALESDHFPEHYRALFYTV